MERTASRNRIIVAAATLFSRAGFHGVSTRDIAQSANVSEGNIFRYFPTKRELFVAAIEHELERLQVRASMLETGAPEEDLQAMLRRLFALVTQTVVDEPGLVRLLHFGVLEFGSEMGPVYRKHLDVFLQSCTARLERCWCAEPWRNVDPRVALLTMVSSVAMLRLYPTWMGAELPFASVENAAAYCVELWCRALCEPAAT